MTLPESVVVLAVVGILAGLGAGPIREGLGRARLRAAATTLGRRMVAARWQAVAGRASVALRFEAEGDGWRVVTYVDGDADGVRSSDIRAGTDRPAGSVFRPRDGGGTVRFGIPTNGRFPRVPPSRGHVVSGDPIRFGSSNLASFSPLGGATPGTVYFTDDEGRLAAVVLYGATGRVRIVNFDRSAGVWRR